MCFKYIKYFLFSTVWDGLEEECTGEHYKRLAILPLSGVVHGAMSTNDLKCTKRTDRFCYSDKALPLEDEWIKVAV